MAKHGRGSWRLLALLAALGWEAAAFAADGNNRRSAEARARWLQRTCRRVLRALAIEVESRGEPARAGAVVVANHVSYLDIVVLGALTPVVFVAKREVRAWPLFGWFAAKAGTRFIDRERRGDGARIGEELGPLLAAGVTTVLFLEGTTTDGRDVAPFKASLLEPALRHAWTVVPAGLVYAVPSGHSVEHEVCWWGDMTLTPHLWNLSTLGWVRARVAWGDALTAKASAGLDRKVFAAQLRERVVELRAWRGNTNPE